MSFETAKCYTRRYAQGHLQKLTGTGYDLGGGEDCLRLPHANVKLWDKKNGNGDAQLLQGIEDESLDFIYSSHMLEHMKNPIYAMNRWLNCIKKGGYLYVAVPDFLLYEGGVKITNGFHKCAFSMDRKTDLSIPLYNVFDFLLKETNQVFDITYVGFCDDNYNYDLDPKIDQTRKLGVCHIEWMLKKK